MGFWLLALTFLFATAGLWAIRRNQANRREKRILETFAERARRLDPERLDAAMRTTAEAEALLVEATPTGYTLSGPVAHRGTIRVLARLTRDRGSGAERVRLEARVESAGPLPAGFWFRQAASERAGVTGDRRFDATSHVEAPSRSLVLAVLGPEVRSLLEGLGGSLFIARHHAEWRGTRAVPYAAEALRLLPRLAAALLEVDAEDTPATIARNLRRETERAARIVSLEHLLAEHREHSATQHTLRRLLRDPDPEIRVRAALAVEPEGTPVLRSLLVMPNLRAHIRRMAAERFPRGDPELEGMFLGWLEGAHPELQVQGAELLEWLGGPSALPPLRRAEQEAGLAEVRQAARRAIAAIEASFEGGAGALALAPEATEGAVSPSAPDVEDTQEHRPKEKPDR